MDGAIQPRDDPRMIDILYIGITVACVILTFGLMVLCEQLMPERERSRP